MCIRDSQIGGENADEITVPVTLIDQTLSVTDPADVSYFPLTERTLSFTVVNTTGNALTSLVPSCPSAWNCYVQGASPQNVGCLLYTSRCV